MIEIKHRSTGEVLLRYEGRTWKPGTLMSAELSGARLKGAELSGLTLDCARFEGADLEGAALRNAQLSVADFNHANLRGSDIQGAVLHLADLRDGDLRGADLSGADLTGACLLGTDLRDVRLEGTKLWAAYYDDATRWPTEACLLGTVRLGEHVEGPILDFWCRFTYGPHLIGNGFFAEPAADRARPGQPSGYQHWFGGSRWQGVGPGGTGQQPILLLTLDLIDPRLSIIQVPGLDELPLAYPLNWWNTPERLSFHIDPKKRIVQLEEGVSDSPDLATGEFAYPDPLPETRVHLRPMTVADWPVHPRPYFGAQGQADATQTGPKFIRVLGPPRWLQRSIYDQCECGEPLRYICGIDSDDYHHPAPFLGGKPFSLGEGVLYFFLCERCPRVVAWTQSS